MQIFYYPQILCRNPPNSSLLIFLLAKETRFAWTDETRICWWPESSWNIWLQNLIHVVDESLSMLWVFSLCGYVLHTCAMEASHVERVAYIPSDLSVRRRDLRQSGGRVSLVSSARPHTVCHWYLIKCYQVTAASSFVLSALCRSPCTPPLITVSPSVAPFPSIWASLHHLPPPDPSLTPHNL